MTYSTVIIKIYNYSLGIITVHLTNAMLCLISSAAYLCTITVILKVLQLFAVTTSEDPINRFTNPSPRLCHCDT
jgi:hypothetical protein